ncbi:uncharacterized protein BDZ99DRAFT_204513 [Mytilinidion resinicola]|uniref:Uncharacterized protein n=1 Tax=Mytilinidion resinicola TaxID=574789 RepID=A0A6A6Y1H4_9PEZI|nr:uncharacterized protein BDZ99DRAFT_204513 [Mytilinidion resinicola]KAF2802489.1 hypothetical protein BDZ99DRAFT_204513 [Mytilinidion resinicola]
MDVDHESDSDDPSLFQRIRLLEPKGIAWTALHGIVNIQKNGIEALNMYPVHLEVEGRCGENVSPLLSWGAVQTSNPLPLFSNDSMSYFEVLLGALDKCACHNQGQTLEDVKVAVGYCIDLRNPECLIRAMVEVLERVQLDDGKVNPIINNWGHLEFVDSLGSWVPGDLIGCLLDPIRGQCIFSRQTPEARQQRHFGLLTAASSHTKYRPFSAESWRPTVFFGPGSSVVANFGQRPFQFNLNNYIEGIEFGPKRVPSRPLIDLHRPLAGAKIDIHKNRRMR